MKTLLAVLATNLFLLVHSFSFAQSAENTASGSKDSTVVAAPKVYKTAEIAYEIENTNRLVKENAKLLESYRNTAEIDTAFDKLSKHLVTEFADFDKYDKQNLSKFFLINTKRVWSSYHAQLNNWQKKLEDRLQELLKIAENTKKREDMWTETSSSPTMNILPEETTGRIAETIKNLQELETKLYSVIKEISVSDSRIVDQIIIVDQHVEEIEGLQKSYRESMFKAIRPTIWNITLKDTFEGTVASRLHKVWYDNTKSFKESYPAFKEYFSAFFTWSIFILISIVLLRFFYFKHNPEKLQSSNADINVLVVRNPVASVLYLLLFIFFLLFKNIPLALSGIVNFSMLIITYFLLKPYISPSGKRLILTFIPLLVINISEIVCWYFGDYARLYLLFEAGLGVLLISFLATPSFKRNLQNDRRYIVLLNVLGYPVLAAYILGFVVNLFGFQNLTVFLLKVGIQISYGLIIFIGAWEITKSSVFCLFEVLTHFKKEKSPQYFSLLQKRLSLFVSLFYGYIGFRTLLLILELDSQFYEGFDLFMKTERHIGSFNFTYGAIIQFSVVMLITWGIVSTIKIILNEENFQRTQRLRGVPAAISITLRMIIAFGGTLFALSVAGIDISKISIMLGAFSVGIGFGLQNIVSNFISGLILIYERPIQVGDTIEINTLMGEVKEIGIRSSRVKTFDGAEVIVPNSILVSDQLINWTLSDDKRRIELIVGVAYGNDPVEIIDILKQIAIENQLVSKFPEPMVLFNEFADSSLNFRLLCWVMFANGVQVKSELAIAIDKAFKARNIEIPFPQMDLHLVDVPAQTKDNREKTNEN